MAHAPPAKEKSKQIDNNERDEFPAPLDGGWGWVVVMASFLIHIVTDGLTYSFGMFYRTFVEEFHEGLGYTAWIASLLVGMTLCSGPISSYFVNRYGCRAVTIAGSILAAVCLVLSHFAQNVSTLIITIGVGVGTGLGLIYLPAIVSVTMYFEKYRSLATGIAVCGSGLGTFIFSPLTDYLITTLGWRVAILVIAGIVLHCAIFGALFRPLERQSQPTDAIDSPPPYEPNTYDCDTNHTHNHNNHRRRINSFRVPSVNVIAEASNGDNQLTRSHSVGHNGLLVKSNGESQGLLNATFHGAKNGKVEGMRSTLSQPLLLHSTSDREPKNLREHHGFWKSGTLSRPDIFYQGSLNNIPHYRSQGELCSGADRYGSLRRIDEDEEETADQLCCSLMSDPVFVIFIVSNFLTSIGFNIPYLYLVLVAEKKNVDQGSYLIAIIGIANTLGRIILGYLSDKAWVNRLWVYNTSLTLCGIATFLSVFCYNFATFAIYSSVFGFFIGAYVGLTSVILVDLLGMEKLTDAFGLLLLFQGIASLAGPPAAGFLFDITGSYGPGFIVAGVAIMLSGLMLYAIPYLQRYLERRHQRVSTDEEQRNQITINT